MTNEQRKIELSARVEDLIEQGESFLTDTGNHQKRKTCASCKKGYLGQADSTSCSDKCRKRLQR